MYLWNHENTAILVSLLMSRVWVLFYLNPWTCSCWVFWALTSDHLLAQISPMLLVVLSTQQDKRKKCRIKTRPWNRATLKLFIFHFFPMLTASIQISKCFYVDHVVGYRIWAGLSSSSVTIEGVLGLILGKGTLNPRLVRYAQNCQMGYLFLFEATRDEIATILSMM